MYLVLLFCSVTLGDIIAGEFVEHQLVLDRIWAAEVWTLRSNNASAMNLAYSDEFSTNETCHFVDSVGDYCPRDHAHEYDNNVLLLKAILGYNPAELVPIWDASTIKWMTKDILLVNFYSYMRTAYDKLNHIYLVQGTFYFTTYLTFQPGTKQIINDYSINELEANQAFEITGAMTDAIDVCTNVIWPACGRPGMNYLNDTEFATIEECIAYTSNLPMVGVCPFVRRSKTQGCSSLHGINAFLLPSVHCQHVSPSSTKCQDSCLPECSNCDVNAKCIAEFPNVLDSTPVYKCECLPGYVGNGTHCKEEKCKYGQCGALYGSYGCSDGLCKCTDTFKHNPQHANNLCICPDGGKVIYNNSKPICVPKGRCIKDSWECSQGYSSVSCAVVDNPMAIFRECRCNYGYLGGRNYPCKCPAPKRELWSNLHNGNLCLSTTQCTASWHCGSGKTCFNPPYGDNVGMCV